MSDRSFFWVPGVLPGLNELLTAQGTRLGNNVAGKWTTQYNELKKGLGQKIAIYARRAGFFAPGPGHWTYLFVEEVRRRDPSNILAGGVKLIEDALGPSGGRMTLGDGWSQVLSIKGFWVVDPRSAGALVCWAETDTISFSEMMEERERLRNE